MKGKIKGRMEKGKGNQGKARKGEKIFILVQDCGVDIFVQRLEMYGGDTHMHLWKKSTHAYALCKYKCIIGQMIRSGLVEVGDI